MSKSVYAVSLNRLYTASDTDLVACAAAGHEDGFEELVRRYQWPIVSYSYRC